MRRDQIKSLARGVILAFLGMSIFAAAHFYPWWVWLPVMVAAPVWYWIDQREETERAERQSQLEKQQREVGLRSG